MKKLQLILSILAISTFVACGPSQKDVQNAEEKANTEAVEQKTNEIEQSMSAENSDTTATDSTKTE